MSSAAARPWLISSEYGEVVELEEIAKALRDRAQELDLSPTDLAQKAQCSVLDVARLLSGEPTATVGVLMAVSKALGQVVFSVPRPAAPGIGDGLHVTEPRVKTVVAAALESLKPPAPRKSK